MIKFNFLHSPYKYLVLSMGIFVSLGSSAQSTLSVSINAGSDDMEEYVTGTTIGAFDAGSSDLEMTTEGSGRQIIGLRFNTIALPVGAVITRAYIQFGADEAHTEATTLNIKVQAVDNATTFSLTDKVSTRALVNDSVMWENIPTWAVNDYTDAQKTPDLKKLIQATVNRAGWVKNNSIAFVIKGSGKRVADSFESFETAPTANKPAKLVIEYLVPVTIAIGINADSDDVEENVTGANIDFTSSDLEMTTDKEIQQIIGLRFNKVNLPTNAQVLTAAIQFNADEANTDATTLTIKGQANDNPGTFTLTDKVSTRATTIDSVIWSNIPAWTVNAYTDAQKTPELKSIVQAIVNRSGWSPNNSMAFVIKGTGKRVADAFDEKIATTIAAKLMVTYLGNDGVAVAPVKPKYKVGTFPILKGANWKYNDMGTDLSAENWTAKKYAKDSTWVFGKGKLGYGVTPAATTVLSFGTDAAAKYPTYYFRNTFVATNVAKYDSLELLTNVDDGAIIYVNGVEIKRINMPATVITYNTLATTEISTSGIYTKYKIKNVFVNNDTNTIAVEVHQHNLASTDLVFDLELKNIIPIPTASRGCTGINDMHIGCFTSVPPSTKNEMLNIPTATHKMQMLVQSGMPYTIGGGVVSTNFDFTAYIPDKMTSSTVGHVALNYETTPGGVGMFDVKYNSATKLWSVDTSRSIDFSGVVGTIRNCSGGVTPWETVVTSEESRNGGDLNADGYEDLGWHVEIDPKTNKIVEYGTGKPQKLWAMGRMSHENVAFSNDSITSYYGEDTGDGILYKFVADKKMNLSAGKIYAMKLTTPLVANEPTASAGTWVLVPNTTQSDRNNTFTLAKALGATLFSGIEDAEIGTIDKKIYFTAKGNDRTYRFKDNGATVSEFETFVGGTSYAFVTDTAGVKVEPYGSGNDNLTFDDRGNLYVLQDGGQDHIWMVRPDHTQDNPKVELFATTPIGCEPTGMTFTPDYKFMFISMQNPASTNKASVIDAAGKNVVFNKNTMLVIARKDSFPLANIEKDEAADAEMAMVLYPNPTEGVVNIEFTLNQAGAVKIEVLNMAGSLVSSPIQKSYSVGRNKATIAVEQSGIYMLKVTTPAGVTTQKLVVR